MENFLGIRDLGRKMLVDKGCGKLVEKVEWGILGGEVILML